MAAAAHHKPSQSQARAEQPTNRDFTLVDDDPRDVAAIEATFDADYGSNSDLNYAPGLGEDLLWSPSPAPYPASEEEIIDTINGSGTGQSIAIETADLTSQAIINALVTLAEGGGFDPSDPSTCTANVNVLVAPGATVLQNATIPRTCISIAVSPSTTIHGTMMLFNGGGPIIGSMSLTDSSFTENRELGIALSSTQIAQELSSIFSTDYQ